jgi:2-polyprenyl-3-methyl-5-hydroxy-6-metoxy-1,4-benzoquinol methylase
LLTPTKPVPKEWFPENLKDKKILCLASGGGQQGPILAATGAEVTIFDNSTKQLEKDNFVAQRDNLKIKTLWNQNYQMKTTNQILPCFPQEKLKLQNL